MVLNPLGGTRDFSVLTRTLSCPGWTKGETGFTTNQSFSHLENFCSKCRIWILDVSVVQPYTLFTFLSSNKSSSINGITPEVILCLIALIRTSPGSQEIERRRDFYVIIRNCGN